MQRAAHDTSTDTVAFETALVGSSGLDWEYEVVLRPQRTAGSVLISTAS